MRVRLAVVALVVAATASAAAPPASRLDPGFGRDGVVVKRLTSGGDVGVGVAPLPNGSVVVAAESGGRLEAFKGPDAVLMRLRRDGSLDTRFAQGGTRRVSIGRGFDDVAGVSRLADGRLVVGGAAANLNADQYDDDVAVYAFRTDAQGRLDRSFGRGGVASVRVPTGYSIGSLKGIVTAADGSVVVGASMPDKALEGNQVVLARFDSRGRLDRRFGTRGIVRQRLYGARALARQPDGRLLVAGMSDFPRRDWFLLRLRPNGDRDRSFGGDGLVVTSFGASPEAAQAVGVDARGRIVVAGYTNSSDSSCEKACTLLRLVRYLPDGRLDPSFGTAGRVAPGIGLAHDTLALALQRDGRIVVAGSSYVAGAQFDRQLALWRFDTRGRLDRTFGGGTLVANPSGDPINLDLLTAVATSPDGRIVAAGGAAKPRTGFDSTIIHDVAVVQAR